MAIYALSRVSGKPPENVTASAETPEDAAWLTLAGLDGFADRLEETAVLPPHGAALVIAARAKRGLGGPQLTELLQRLVGRREGPSWPTPAETARAIFALSFLAGEAPTKNARITLNEESVETTREGAVIYGAPLQIGRNDLQVRCDDGRLFVDARLLVSDPAAENLRARSEGITVERTVERAVIVDDRTIWQPLESGAAVKVGDRLRVLLELRTATETRGVEFECPLPGGALAGDPRGRDSHSRRLIARSAHRLDAIRFHLKRLPVSSPEYALELRPILPGTWHMMPATATSADGRSGRSAEFILRVEK